VHALAYPLGAMFDIPHGMANAVMLPCNWSITTRETFKKFREIAIAMNEEDSGLTDRELAGCAAMAVFELAEDLEYRTLRELHIPKGGPFPRWRRRPSRSRAPDEQPRPCPWRRLGNCMRGPMKVGRRSSLCLVSR